MLWKRHRKDVGTSSGEYKPALQELVQYLEPQPSGAQKQPNSKVHEMPSPEYNGQRQAYELPTK